jgi:hypothetical protein
MGACWQQAFSIPLPAFRFYALADGIHKVHSQTSPETSDPTRKTWQLELTPAGFQKAKKSC